MGRVARKAPEKPDVCRECPLYDAPMVRGEGKIDGLGLVIMGEAPAREEVRLRRPFVGETGQKILDPLLNVHLPQNGCPLSRDGVYITNALLCQLNKNAVKEKQVDEAIACCNERRELEGELVGAKFIVGMGATAAKALIDEKVVKTFRGALMESPFGPCSITYHPTYVLRGKKQGTRTSSDVYFQLIFQDLYKAYRMVDPKVPDDDRTFMPAYEIAPPMADVLEFIAWIRENKTLCCVDIECDSIDPLAANLTIIGFGAVVDGVVTAHAVPVWDGCGYTQAELDAFYAAFAALLADPDVPILFHNFTYDVMVLERHGMPTIGKVEDTLIAHYCLYPELPHDLQSVACSYLNVGPWKVNFRRKEAVRNKAYQALARWEEKLEDAGIVLSEFREHADVLEPLTGKKLAAAFEERGLDTEALDRFKKARTARKRADKKLAAIREELDTLFYDEKGHDVASIEELIYNACDVACTLGTWLFMHEVDGPDLAAAQKLYEVDIACAEIARKMQRRGLPVIGDARSNMRRSLAKQLGEYEKSILDAVAEAVDLSRSMNPAFHDGRFDEPDELEKPIEPQTELLNPDGSPAAALEPAYLPGAEEWKRLSTRDQACVRLDLLLKEREEHPHDAKKGFNCMSGAHKSLLLDAYEVPVDELTAKTGQRKMTKDTLVKYKNEFDVVKHMLDYSATHKLLKTFVEGKKIVIGDDGRIHPSWNSKGSINPEDYGTITGRWTSEPNVQNWPYEMRAMIGFRDDEDWTLVGADFSQLEFRILAWFAGQTDLVTAFNEGPVLILEEGNPDHAGLLDAWKAEKKNLKECGEGLDVDGMKLERFKDIIPSSHRDLWMQRILRIDKNARGQVFIERDIHSATAVSIFESEYTFATLKKHKLLRNLTKRATYGGMYGGSAETLYNALHRDFPNIDKRQCEMFLEKFDRIWPNIVAWRKDSHDIATRTGELRTPILGRCRLFPMKRPETTVAYNFPIQATAADIMNTSMLRLYEYVQSRDDLRGKAYPIIQVHDALYWEVHQSIAEEFRGIVEERMSCELEHPDNLVRMSFPVEAKIGKKWSET